MTPAALREAASDLMTDYAERIDSDRLEEWLDLFTEDAVYQVVPRDNFDRGLPVSLILCTNKNMLRDRIVSLRKANEFNLHYDRHIVSNIRIGQGDATIWRLDANFAVFQTNLEGQSRLFSVGRYRNEVRFEGDRLLFCKVLAIVDSFSVPTLLATPL
jgi:anthranilate 1,2-dioxygenase small subunit